MSRFTFPMENILEIKEKLEEQAKNEFSQAMFRLHEAEDKEEELRQRVIEAAESLRSVLNEEIDVMEVSRRENAVEILKLYMREQHLVVMQCEKEVERARDKMTEAMKERKTFDKLKEKAFEAFLKEENAREQKEIDELVSYRFGRV